MDDSWLVRTNRATSAAPAAAAVPAAPPESKGYRAWGRGHPESLLIEFRQRPERGMTAQGVELPQHYLMRVTYTEGPSGDMVSIAFADCIVTVRGQGLHGLRADLRAGKVDFIEEYDSSKWSAVLADEPIVTAIEVKGPGVGRA